MNHCDWNAQGGVATGWNFDRAGYFLPACRASGANPECLPILRGSGAG